MRGKKQHGDAAILTLFLTLGERGMMVVQDDTKRLTITLDLKDAGGRLLSRYEREFHLEAWRIPDACERIVAEWKKDEAAAKKGTTDSQKGRT